MGPFHDYSNGPGAGRGIFMLIFMLLVLGSVIWVAAMLVRDRNRHHAPTPTNVGPAGGRGSDALRILDERLARGEIDAEDYKTRRELLRTPPE